METVADGWGKVGLNTGMEETVSLRFSFVRLHPATNDVPTSSAASSAPALLMSPRTGQIIPGAVPAPCSGATHVARNPPAGQPG